MRIQRTRYFIIGVLLFLSGVGIVFAGAFLWQQLRVTPNPSTVASVNSPTTTSTSHTQQPTTPTPEPPLTIVFVGDMLFDRDIRTLAQQSPNGYDAVLDPALSQYLQQADLVIGNLEGPITDNPSVSVGSAVGSTRNYLFTFPPEVTAFLQKHHFAVNLGNNHINNFGTDGFEQTRAYLDHADLGWFGQLPYLPDATNYSQVFVYEKNGLSLAFINYNQFLGPGIDAAIADIARWRPKVDKVIVYTHWGNEYEPLANATIQAQAQELITAGADLIIGSHPHVEQQQVVIDNKRVYYSLGNFIFDQYFSKEVQQGLVVELTIDPTTQEFLFSEQTVRMSRGVTTLLPKTTAP